MSHDPHHTPPKYEKPDEWHRHTAAEGAPQVEHGAIANPAALAIAFFLMVGALAATVGVIKLYFYSHLSTLRAEKLETSTPAEEWYQYRYNDAPRDLGSYGWVDHETVRIPLDSAIERTVAEYARHAPAPGAGAP